MSFLRRDFSIRKTVQGNRHFRCVLTDPKVTVRENAAQEKDVSNAGQETHEY